MLVREPFDEALAPLNDYHGVGEVGVEVERVHVLDAAEPVRVDVHERHPWTLVHARDDERRRGDRPPDAEPGADAAGQRGLASAERTGEYDEVTRGEPLGDL